MSIRLENEGLMLWYGEDDTPAPNLIEPLGCKALVTFGVYPASSSNIGGVKYRLDGGLIQTLSAVLIHTDYSQARQYFCSTFPVFQNGNKVEYQPIVRCAGRQVPLVTDEINWLSSFCLSSEPNLAPSDLKLKTQSLEQFQQSGQFLPNPNYLGTVSAQLESHPELIGETPDGIRVNWYIKGGTVVGPKLNAKIRPVGGDWMTIRRDGIGILGIRATLETIDGALIDMHASGIYELGENGYQKFLSYKWPDSPSIRAAPRFLTEHSQYKWLNRLQCIGIGEVRMSELLVVYDLYAF
jgi:Protein of unknown function (DUF3237)